MGRSLLLWEGKWWVNPDGIYSRELGSVLSTFLIVVTGVLIDGRPISFFLSFIVCFLSPNSSVELFTRWRICGGVRRATCDVRRATCAAGPGAAQAAASQTPVSKKWKAAGRWGWEKLWLGEAGVGSSGGAGGTEWGGGLQCRQTGYEVLFIDALIM